MPNKTAFKALAKTTATFAERPNVLQFSCFIAEF